ncbi:ribbon-helix-helix protein, CopG family [Streptomyces sp. CC208A]|uniref:ribbon-helix-helix protein, CopG family n=1 Tax=Streptomyces sp. CC208A TaxID=3044573 RepID=UPI0024A927C8|nr:ribbon-helix-helix protein, CopG family [Streptomyces sp. CC208A]
MGSTVLSLRIDSELLDRLKNHAAKRGMSVQDYVVRTLIREDFDERFKTAVEETEKFYGAEKPYGAEPEPPGVAPHAQVRPSAGIA